LLGVAAAAVLALVFCGWSVGGADLARLYQAGFARSAVRLLPLAVVDTREAAILRKRLERADLVCSFTPERLRATRPFMLADDGRFWPSLNDLHPLARIGLTWHGAGMGELVVTPEGAPSWRTPLRCTGLVRPDWSPYSGLVAYYDLGRVWIADVQGRRFQSLVQEPRLDAGGDLKFSSDGTALAFYFDADKTWMVQDLFVLGETKP
jgi:hypothetical protein